MKIIGFDCETDLITAGNKTPALVCLSLAGGLDTQEVYEALKGLGRAVPTKRGWAVVLSADAALPALRIAVEGSDLLVAHNMPFDVGVLANHAAPVRAVAGETRAPNAVLQWASEAVEAQALADTMVVEKLITIATDNAEYDRRFTPQRKTSYALARLVETYTGVDISGDKTRLSALQKNNVPRDQWPWRYRYIDLVDTPLADWPPTALAYAAEDSVWAREVYLRQRSKDLDVAGYPVVHDGQVTDEWPQTASWLALHMMAVEGAPVDEHTVGLFRQDIDALLGDYHEACRALGIVRINRCKTCGDSNGGTGLVGQFPDLRVCPVCRGQQHAECIAQGLYKTKAQAGIGKLYTKRLAAIVRWGYKGHPPMTTRPRKQSPSAYAKWTPSVKTDEETLSVINHPMVQQFVTGKKATKWRGTYLPPLVEALRDGGRLTSSPNVLVRSGRTSWTGPNLQNPPRKGRFRECFKAPEGWVMASIDYSTLELAVLSQVNLALFGTSRMADLINADTDLHAWFGAKLLGIGYADMEARLAAGDGHAKAIRQLAKIPNFGLPGGLGPKGLVKYAAGYGVYLDVDSPVVNDQGVSLPSARDLCRAWKAAFPEMASYFAMLSHESNMSADGRFPVRQLGSGRVRSGATYTSGANTYFQGLAADGAKHAMWLLFKACYTDERSPLFGCRVWGFIHDEFLLMGPRDSAHAWAQEASTIMVDAMMKYTPQVKQAAPPALMERWYKSADPVYTHEGALIPWCPWGDMPPWAQEEAPDGLSKNGRVLYASGLLDALAAGAEPSEALDEAAAVAAHGRIG